MFHKVLFFETFILYECSVVFELHLFSSFLDFEKLDRDRDELEVDEHWAAFTATSRQNNSNSDVKKLWGDRISKKKRVYRRETSRENSKSDVKKLWEDRSLRTRSGESLGRSKSKSRKIEVEKV